MIRYLDVFYHSSQVGTLAITKDNKIAFQYAPNWIQNGFSISPLSLPLSNDIYYANKPYFHGLFGVFGDSFPDSWGELLIKRYLKNKNIEYDSLNILEKLSLISNNSLGGLEYRPSKHIPNAIDIINLDEIQDDISNILGNKKVNNYETLFSLGGSSGGTRPKIMTKINNKDVIIKFHNHIDPSNIADLEYKYMSLAKEAGINIPEILLLKGQKNTYFMIDRFDRKDNQRIHMISAAALLECDYNSPAVDYLDLIKLTKILTNNKNDVIEMYRRMVFNCIFDNLDDHTKNFAFLYDEDIKMYRLSPAFDITPSNTYYNEHVTSIDGKGKNITTLDMIEVAKKSGISKQIAEKIISHISNLKRSYRANKKA